jgi:hypothetical protein
MSGCLHRERLTTRLVVRIILWSPLSRSLRSLRFGPREGFRFSFSIACSVLSLRVKDLSLALPLEMAFGLRRIQWGGQLLGRCKIQCIIGIIIPPSQASF